MGALSTATVAVPHLATPVRFANGSFDMVEQDSPEHILQCVVAIASARQGDVLDDHDFGIPDELFTVQPVDLAAIQAAIQRQEPRAAYVLATHPDAQATLEAVIDIRVRSRAA